MAGHIYPWWAGALLATSMRRLRQVPEAIVGPYVRPGMRLVDLGCGMGFFSLPMAELAGSGGKVFCIDVQEGMLRGLLKRAAKDGVAERIVARSCAPESLRTADLEGSIDFALVFNVVHELPDRSRFLDELVVLLRPGGRALICEPSGHVSAADFRALLGEAEKCGLVAGPGPILRGEHSALLEKAGGGA